MVPTIRIHSLAAALLAVAVPALPAAARQAATDESDSKATQALLCEDWVSATTTDPEVDLEALKATKLKPGLTFFMTEDNHYSLAMFGNMKEVFHGDFYNSHENVRSEMRDTNLDGAFIHRTIKADLIDIMAVSGLETDTPQVIWQRFRLDEDFPLETQLIASCPRLTPG